LNSLTEEPVAGIAGVFFGGLPGPFLGERERRSEGDPVCFELPGPA